MLSLSKEVPRHVRVDRFRWCVREFSRMSQEWRAIRSKHPKAMDRCFWCRTRFADGDMMALAQPVKGANVVLCQKCADELLASGHAEADPA